jgi:hypothetical protein
VEEGGRFGGRYNLGLEGGYTWQIHIHVAQFGGRKQIKSEIEPKHNNLAETA